MCVSVKMWQGATIEELSSIFFLAHIFWLSENCCISFTSCWVRENSKSIMAGSAAVPIPTCLYVSAFCNIPIPNYNVLHSGAAKLTTDRLPTTTTLSKEWHLWLLCVRSYSLAPWAVLWLLSNLFSSSGLISQRLAGSRAKGRHQSTLQTSLGL